MLTPRDRVRLVVRDQAAWIVFVGVAMYFVAWIGHGQDAAPHAIEFDTWICLDVILALLAWVMYLV